METQRILAELRFKAGLSVRELADATGLSRTCCWRAETPGLALVRGPTLAEILVKGYGMKRDGKRYRDVFAAWARDRGGPDGYVEGSLKDRIIEAVKEMDGAALKKLEQWLGL